MASVSVTQLIGPALTFTRNLLFTKPFSVKKWLKLALIAWLAGEAFVTGGGGGGGFNFPFPGQERPYPSQDFYQITHWIIEHIVEIIIIVAIVVAIIITLSLIFAVLRAIFGFIFLEALATKNHNSIRSGFAQYQSLGWRLFFFRLIYGLIVFFLVILAIGIPILIAIGSVGGIQGLEKAGWVVILLLIFGIIILLIPILIISALIDSFTNNFVVPTMYVHHLGVLPAWKRYWKTFRAHVWDTVRFYLMKFVLAMGGGIISFVVFLITLIPFALIGVILGFLVYFTLSALNLAIAKVGIIIISVATPLFLLVFPLIVVMVCLMLPLAVFFRVYTLMFLSACDSELTVLKEDHHSFPEYPWQVAETPPT